jgi:hypothetical protein
MDGFEDLAPFSDGERKLLTAQSAQARPDRIRHLLVQMRQSAHAHARAPALALALANATPATSEK